MSFAITYSLALAAALFSCSALLSATSESVAPLLRRLLAGTAALIATLFILEPTLLSLDAGTTLFLEVADKNGVPQQRSLPLAIQETGQLPISGALLVLCSFGVIATRKWWGRAALALAPMTLLFWASRAPLLLGVSWSGEQAVERFFALAAAEGQLDRASLLAYALPTEHWVYFPPGGGLALLLSACALLTLLPSRAFVALSSGSLRSSLQFLATLCALVAYLLKLSASGGIAVDPESLRLLSTLLLVSIGGSRASAPLQLCSGLAAFLLLTYP